jgi:LSD1 subclass zinc finger protein
VRLLRGREALLEVSSKLIEMLVCPVCKTPVKLTPDSQGLRCSTCCLIYPIRDGFPVMIKDEARSESSTEAASGH